MINRTGSVAKLVRLVCVLALVMVVFAHKPLSAPPLAVQFAAYVLPDGTLPTLCLNEDPSTPIGVVKDHGCDACRLANAILLPEPPEIAAQALRMSTATRVLERQHHLARLLYPPGSGPRAPPSIMIQT